jgi:hypothetical protein
MKIWIFTMVSTWVSVDSRCAIPTCWKLIFYYEIYNNIFKEFDVSQVWAHGRLWETWNLEHYDNYCILGFSLPTIWASLRGRVRLGLIFIGFTWCLYSWHASRDWWRIRFLVVPFPICGPPHLGYLLAWILILAPCFFFSPFLWVLSFYNV